MMRSCISSDTFPLFSSSSPLLFSPRLLLFQTLCQFSGNPGGLSYTFSAGQCSNGLPSGDCIALQRRTSQSGRDAAFKAYVSPARIEWWNDSPSSSATLAVEYLCGTPPTGVEVTTCAWNTASPNSGSSSHRGRYNCGPVGDGRSVSVVVTTPTGPASTHALTCASHMLYTAVLQLIFRLRTARMVCQRATALLVLPSARRTTSTRTGSLALPGCQSLT